MAVDIRAQPVGNTINNDADFRAWIQAFDAEMLAVGMVASADTGQVDPAAAVKSGSVNTFSGYRIYRFSGPRQATRPWFIKVEFGTGGVATRIAIRVQVASATNGSGGLSGATSTQATITPLTSALSGNMYCSCDTDSLRWIFYSAAVGNGGTMGMFVERARDPDTAAQDDAYTMFAYWGGNGGNGGVQIHSSVGWGGNSQTYWELMQFGFGTAPHLGGNAALIQVMPMIYYVGKLWQWSEVCYREADIPAGSQFTAKLCGEDRTFFAVGGMGPAVGTGVLSAAIKASFAMLWE